MRRPIMTTRHRLILIIAVGVIVAGVLVVAAITRSPNSGQDHADSTQGAGASPTVTASESSSGKQGTGRTPQGKESTHKDHDDNQEVDVARRKSGDPRALGKRDAPVVLTEWADFRCPFCGVWARDTKPKLMKYVKQGTLRIEFRDMPIYGEQSVNAANAARAAGDQGRFWQFYDAVYEAAPKRGHPKLTTAKLDRFAEQAGVKNMGAFRRAVNHKKYKKQIQQDAQLATQLGATSTPAFLINDTPILGAQPTDVFVQAIKKQADG